MRRGRIGRIRGRILGRSGRRRDEFEPLGDVLALSIALSLFTTRSRRIILAHVRGFDVSIRVAGRTERFEAYRTLHPFGFSGYFERLRMIAIFGRRRFRVALLLLVGLLLMLRRIGRSGR